MRSSPVMKSARKTGPCSRRSSPPASSTTSTRPPTSPKHSRRSSTAIPIAASKTSCRGDSAKRQASLNRVAAKRLRMYFNDVQPTGIGPQRQPGMFSSSAPMAGYPKIYNIQMDPHEDLQVGALFGWTFGPMFEEVEKYLESVKKYPNPPAPNITSFTSHS